MVLVVMLDETDPALIVKLKLGETDLVLTSRSSSVAMCMVARDRDGGGEELSQQAGFLQLPNIMLMNPPINTNGRNVMYIKHSLCVSEPHSDKI